jgi:hypothetical protein
VVRYPAGERDLIFLYSKVSRPALEAQPEPYLMLSWVLYEDKAAEGETDHSLPFSVVIKNEWSYMCTPPYTYMPSTVTNVALFVFKQQSGTNVEALHEVVALAFSYVI